ncbi:MAG: galactose mutarotase [Muribaculaceae bacterium]|nr:galactose mutarotase [Muribaculaceae bacterium]
MELIKLTNSSGASVTLSPLGAGIVSIVVPDKEGKLENVALSYASPEDYMNDGPCLGKIPGRYANRIGKGKLTVKDKDYQLAVNCGPHHLHGGPTGFQNRIWDAEKFPGGVRFTYHSADGEENYPGNVKVVAEYRWSDDNVLTLDLTATTDAPTVINLTNHLYVNLDGADSGNALSQLLTLKSDRFLVTDDSLCPTGDLASVEGTPMDFTTEKPVGRDIHSDFKPLLVGKGYDHCFAIKDWKRGELVEDVAVLRSERSGRVMAISSTQPALQLYTGNWLKGSPKNASGGFYEDYDGIAIECQGYPDAPNHPEFPSQLLLPGEPYRETIRFSFR